MTRLETLELLTQILESIKYFEHRIDMAEWSNEFGRGQRNFDVNLENKHDIHICRMCIDRLNMRFDKYTNTLK